MMFYSANLLRCCAIESENGFFSYFFSGEKVGENRPPYLPLPGPTPAVCIMSLVNYTDVRS